MDTDPNSTDKQPERMGQSNLSDDNSEKYFAAQNTVNMYRHCESNYESSEDLRCLGLQPMIAISETSKCIIYLYRYLDRISCHSSQQRRRIEMIPLYSYRPPSSYRGSFQ